MNPKDSQNKEITWRNAAALEGYVRRLNDVADKLAEKNRQLRKWHDVLRDRVVALMGTDLVGGWVGGGGGHGQLRKWHDVLRDRVVALMGCVCGGAGARSWWRVRLCVCVN